jgi:pimeloyl-ACP methyl ester carboxylesterase
MQTNNWIDKAEFPFTNKYVTIDGQQMHYVDEGKSETILFVHGIPDWSFGWRHLIKALPANYRCVAPDHIGFGLSSKTIDIPLTIEAHGERLLNFVKQLQLKNIHIVLHDFGGPIGLTYALQDIKNIKSISVFNTWMWPLKGTPHFDAGAKVVNNFLGKFLYLTCNFSVRFMLKSSYADKKNLPPHVFKHYLKAQESKEARMATYKLAQSLTGEHTHMDWIWSQRNLLKEKPLLIMWGMKDKFVPAEILLPKWKENFPNAKVAELNNAGHFAQEEAPAEMQALLTRFWNGIN